MVKLKLKFLNCFYLMIHPWKAIWKVKLPTKIGFSLWTWRNILTIKS